MPDTCGAIREELPLLAQHNRRARRRVLGATAVFSLVYFNVCGGPWGSEEIVSDAGPLPYVLQAERQGPPSMWTLSPRTLTIVLCAPLRLRRTTNVKGARGASPLPCVVEPSDGFGYGGAIFSVPGQRWILSRKFRTPHRKRNETHETLLARARRCTPPRARWKWVAEAFGPFWGFRAF